MPRQLLLQVVWVWGLKLEGRLGLREWLGLGPGRLCGVVGDRGLEPHQLLLHVVRVWGLELGGHIGLRERLWLGPGSLCGGFGDWGLVPSQFFFLVGFSLKRHFLGLTVILEVLQSPVHQITSYSA